MVDVKKCPHCGEEVLAAAKKCKHCGEWFEKKTNVNFAKPIRTSVVQPIEAPRNEQNSQGQTIIVNQAPQLQSNGIGTAGFVLALIALFLSWIPGVGWVMWFLGLILSFIGMFKSPKGLAITGFIVSLIDLIVLIFVIGAIVSMFGILAH